MNISKTHKRFSERLNDPRVFTNPEEFLGPNCEAVLNYWLILDNLSQDKLETIDKRYWGFYYNQRSEWFKAANEAIKASEETIGWEFAYDAANAAFDVYGWAAWGTRELIGMHLLLDQQKPLTFFTMFMNSI